MKKILILFFLGTILTGCHNLPTIYKTKVYNIPSKTVFVPTGSTLKGAILLAGSTRGWNTKLIKEGVIEAKITRRTVSATIRIDYTDEDYSITYMDSTGFSYNAENQTIHPTYNRWIRNLDKSILQELINHEIRRLRLENKTIL